VEINMPNHKDKFQKLIKETFNLALGKEVTPPLAVTEETPTNQDTLSNQETQSDDKKLKTHRTFMGELSELIFPLCVGDYFVTNKTTTEDILNAIEHINVTKERKFIIFDSEVNEASSLFLSKSEDLKARILAAKKETKKVPSEKSIKEYSDTKSEELFKDIGIESEVTSLKSKILQHFIQYKDSEDNSKFKFEGKEVTDKFTIYYFAHLYRSKQHASEGQKETDALKWLRERSRGLANEVSAQELAFADSKVIKQGRGGVSVAIRFVIVPQETINEEIEHKKVAFKIEDSNDSIRIALNVNYSEDLISDIAQVITERGEKLDDMIRMIETYLENIMAIPDIEEARKYLEYLASNNEIDYIDLVISSSGSLGAHGGSGVAGNIKKDAEIKVIEFNAMNRSGIIDQKVYSFSLKASDRKDVAIIQFNDKWRNDIEWVFQASGLDFKKLQWDHYAPSGDSDAIMENMKKYFMSIEKSNNDKLVQFMFAMLDLYAHGHEDSTLVTISKSKKDIKVYSTLISEYIRARKIYVSVLDMSDPANVATYYDRVAKRKGEVKKGRKPSLDLKQFLLQLTDESNDSFGVFKLVESQTRRAGLDEARGRPRAEVTFNPYKIVIDDELDDLCKKLSTDLKDERRRKLWSVNRIFRRTFLIDKLIQKNLQYPKLIMQYKEIIESFASILNFYSKSVSTDEIDYKLIERIKLDKTFDLTRHFIDEYSVLKDFMIDSKQLDPQWEKSLDKFYGTAIVYAQQKCVTLIKQTQGGSYQQ
jgi:hypothetical protein